MSPKRDESGNLVQLESERIAEERARDDAEIEHILDGFAGKGYMVSIHRMQPRWCQGFLDTWPLEEAISLQDIRQEFGGRRFSLKVKRSDGSYVKTLPVWIDDEPKRDGRPIRLASQEFADRNTPILASGGAPQTTEILRYMQASNDRTLKLLGDMLTAQKNAPPGTMPDIPGQLAAMSSMLDFFSKMQERIGSGGGLGGGEQSGMAQMFMEMMRDKFASDRAESTRARPPAKALPPRRRPTPQPLAPDYAPQHRAAAPPAGMYGTGTPPPWVKDPDAPAPLANPGAPPAPAPAPAPQEEDPEEYEPNEEDTAADLVDLGPDRAGLAIASYLNSVDAATAKATIEAVMGQPVDLDKIAAAVPHFSGGGANTTDPRGPSSGQ